MSVLADLVASARQRARALPKGEPAARPAGPGFADALRGRDRLKVIAEFKQASPSRGSIVRHDLREQVRRYEGAGAAAVSVLTEPTRFAGSLEHLEEAAAALGVPVLMKDFVVDPAQVRVAACLGARAVLLIVRCLAPAELRELAAACSGYGLTPLVECHSEREVELALDLEDAVVGVNNRDLDDLRCDLEIAPRLLAEVPAGRVAVAESGYEKAEDARALRGRADAILVGTALMVAPDPARLIRELSG